MWGAIIMIYNAVLFSSLTCPDDSKKSNHRYIKDLKKHISLFLKALKKSKYRYVKSSQKAYMFVLESPGLPIFGWKRKENDNECSFLLSIYS